MATEEKKRLEANYNKSANWLRWGLCYSYPLAAFYIYLPCTAGDERDQATKRGANEKL